MLCYMPKSLLRTMFDLIHRFVSCIAGTVRKATGHTKKILVQMELIQHSREPVQSPLCSLYPASAVCIQEDFLSLREIIGFIKIIVYFPPKLIIIFAIIHTTEIVRMDQSMTFAFRRFRLDSFVHIDHPGELTVVLTMRSIR
ncbi:hypothetical protein GCWU000341_01823 [Oribacterium sp. oral taxon 078 str. F0262]|nr:hypothetical protein GCWU000341_01823 [Oribacterium sp. oral taxon 078 str. F0262]